MKQIIYSRGTSNTSKNILNPPRPQGQLFCAYSASTRWSRYTRIRRRDLWKRGTLFARSIFKKTEQAAPFKRAIRSALALVTKLTVAINAVRAPLLCMLIPSKLGNLSISIT